MQDWERDGGLERKSERREQRESNAFFIFFCTFTLAHSHSTHTSSLHSILLHPAWMELGESKDHMYRVDQVGLPRRWINRRQVFKVAYTTSFALSLKVAFDHTAPLQQVRTNIRFASIIHLKNYGNFTFYNIGATSRHFKTLKGCFLYNNPFQITCKQLT